MGVTSLPLERIRPGVERLVELIRSQVRDYVEQLPTSKGEWLRGEALSDVMTGATILYREVDGSPCTIKYHKSGLMTGVLGYSNEEQDQGRWRIEDDRFWRQSSSSTTTGRSSTRCSSSKAAVTTLRTTTRPPGPLQKQHLDLWTPDNRG
jgi:hypothetical protein